MNNEDNPKREESNLGEESETSAPPVTPPGDDRPSDSTGDSPSGVPGVASTDSLGDEKDDTYVARVARGAGISTAGQGVGRVLGFLTQAAISRLFGVETFGFYTSGVAAVNLGQIISRFGMENGVVRYVAHHRDRKSVV